jgi:hypothetical protein
MFEEYVSNNNNNNNNNNNRNNHENCCPQLPGTVLRINIPAGATINLLNLIELTSPSGICLIVRIPLLAGNGGVDVAGLINNIKQAGGNVQFA